MSKKKKKKKCIYNVGHLKLRSVSKIKPAVPGGKCATMEGDGESTENARRDRAELAKE